MFLQQNGVVQQQGSIQPQCTVVYTKQNYKPFSNHLMYSALQFFENAQFAPLPLSISIICLKTDQHHSWTKNFCWQVAQLWIFRNTFVSFRIHRLFCDKATSNNEQLHPNHVYTQDNIYKETANEKLVQEMGWKCRSRGGSRMAKGK